MMQNLRSAGLHQSLSISRPPLNHSPTYTVNFESGQKCSLADRLLRRRHPRHPKTRTRWSKFSKVRSPPIAQVRAPLPVPIPGRSFRRRSHSPHQRSPSHHRADPRRTRSRKNPRIATPAGFRRTMSVPHLPRHLPSVTLIGSRSAVSSTIRWTTFLRCADF